MTGSRDGSSVVQRDPRPARLFHLAVAIPALGVILLLATLQAEDALAQAAGLAGIVFWTALIALVALLPVPAWRGLRVSVDFPLVIAVALLYPPGAAGLMLLLAASDPRELRREVPPLRAVFNRTQVALATLGASLTFNILRGNLDDWGGLAVAGPAAVVTFYVINVAMVSLSVSLAHNLRVTSILRQMRVGDLAEFLVSYLGLGFLGVLLARLFLDSGWWTVAMFAAPLVLARQAFIRARALEQLTLELQDREVVLRALSNRLAEERHDERMEIAGYLHDDLAQILYRMRLMGDIAQKHLERGTLPGVRDELAGIGEARDEAADLVRGLIRDLRRSPIGRTGLSQALTSLADEVASDPVLRVETNINGVRMPAPVQLLCYQIAKEALANAVKHAHPTRIRLSLESDTDHAILTVADDGRGFDPDGEEPEGHFGLTLMRERAMVSGGTLDIESAPGEGTTVVATFPLSPEDEPRVQPADT
jgi:signal transduction histidine kinase